MKTSYLKFLLLLTVLLTTASAVSAQKKMSWRKHRKAAEAAFETGDYGEAGYHYQQAWQKKKKKTELIFKAGEAFYLDRNYRDAASAYQEVKDENDEYELVGLKYARSLKQDGQYDKAINAFEAFNASYTGDGKAILEEIIRTEVQGAELAKQLMANPKEMDFEHLPGTINTDAEEFAAVPFSDEVIYYTSTSGDRARIYSSIQGEGGWTKGRTPENFPVITDGHYAHGSLSPDGQQFYFSICNDNDPYNNITSRCELYVVRRNGSNWSKPEKLPSTINVDGFTTTQPNVVYNGDVEMLFFASDRKGGRGGMDIWYVARNRSQGGSNFSAPVNLGPTINTLGDEMAPFYDNQDQILYFASNGHPSMGGFDIFAARGSLSNWSIPENQGVPINSSADDYFYTRSNSGALGFVSSNRVFAGEKLNTTNDDVYEFRLTPRTMMLEGQVFEEATDNPLTPYTLSLYEINQNGEENLILNRQFSTPDYRFEVLPNRQFMIQVNREGYRPAGYTFTTDNPNVFSYGQPIYLAKMDLPPEPETPTEPEGESGNEAFPEVEYTARGFGPYDKKEYVSSAPRFDGTYYKVQIIATRKYAPDNSKFAGVESMGEVHTEALTGNNLTRVLVGTYFTGEEAKAAQSQLRQMGFSGAFVVKYEDGIRFGRVNL